MRAPDVHLRRFNRDLSWLAFNDRVLAQAEDTAMPLLERTKFLAIFASNLDEFFMKRIGLAKRRLIERGSRDEPGEDGHTVASVLAESRRTIVAHQQRLAECWLHSIKPGLAEAGIRLAHPAELTSAELAPLDAWFESNVFPILTPLAVDPSHRFPFISNLSENFGMLLERSPGHGPSVFARVKIPSVVRRFVPVEDPASDTRGRDITLVQLDDLIERHLPSLFPGTRVVSVTPFRVTRSAAIEGPDEDDDDLLQSVEDELRRRRFAEAVRLETTPEASAEVLRFVTTQLNLDDADVYTRLGPLEYQDLFELVSLPRPDLKIESWKPVVPPALSGLPALPEDRTQPPRPAAISAEDEDEGPPQSIFDRIRERDVLLHHPYESFQDSVERFIAEAAGDPDVLAIKQTIYRTTPDSPFVRSLIEAAEEGKNVAALVELRARFDEHRNVSFARQLEHAGVHVAYGVAGLKTHCKCSLVVRRESDEHGREILRAYAHIGTGNYHPKTAQLYTDLGLLTADPAITRDVVRIFNTLTGNGSAQDYERLLVAPDGMRPAYLDLIEAEIDAAKTGKPSRIVVKMNQLEDREIIEKLYEASSAGVPVTAFVRGFCTLRPGVPGLSDNIEVISVVGRFLEHSRIFYFAAGSDPAKNPADGVFSIGSADWMSRNLSDRVEASTPVTDPEAKARLWQIFDVMLRDRARSWRLRRDGTYHRIEQDGDHPADSDERIGTFRALMRATLQQARG